jgi:hypothetical protein
MTNPPVEGQTSYELYARERDAILASLGRRARLLAERLNAIGIIASLHMIHVHICVYG